MKRFILATVVLGLIPAMSLAQGRYTGGNHGGYNGGYNGPNRGGYVGGNHGGYNGGFGLHSVINSGWRGYGYCAPRPVVIVQPVPICRPVPIYRPVPNHGGGYQGGYGGGYSGGYGGSVYYNSGNGGQSNWGFSFGYRGY